MPSEKDVLNEKIRETEETNARVNLITDHKVYAQLNPLYATRGGPHKSMIEFSLINTVYNNILIEPQQSSTGLKGKNQTTS